MKKLHCGNVASLRGGTIIQAILALIVLSFTLPASAQIRREANYSSFINPQSGHVASLNMFGAGGTFLIEGGVVFEGSAKFYLEREGKSTEVAILNVGISVGREGTTEVVYDGKRYAIQMHAGLSCPLGKLIARGGRLAYTIPEQSGGEAARRLEASGVVQDDADDRYIAKEFYKTKFSDLLFASDFANVVSLPPLLERSIRNSVNSATSSDQALAQGEGSYINSDFQVTYQVFLIEGAGRAEISGVPLRYNWLYSDKGSAIVSSVEAFSQKWAEGQKLADLQSGGGAITQYDIVSLYQAAGVFRQMSISKNAEFKTFVVRACESQSR